MKKFSIFIAVIALLLTAQTTECGTPQYYSALQYYRAFTPKGKQVLITTLTRIGIPQYKNICFQRSGNPNNPLVPTILLSKEAFDEFNSPDKQFSRALHRTFWCAAKGGLYGSLGIIAAGCTVGALTNSSAVGAGAITILLWSGFTPGACAFAGGLVGLYRSKYKPDFNYLSFPDEGSAQGIQFTELNKRLAKLGKDRNGLSNAYTERNLAQDTGYYPSEE